MTTDTATALDAVDRFIGVGEDLARQPVTSDPGCAAALDSLVEVIQILLAANENMAGWLNRLTQFNFRAHESRQDFMRLVADCNTAKSGTDLRRMKWLGSEIWQMCDTHIRVAVGDMFVQAEPIPAQLDEAFRRLGRSWSCPGPRRLRCLSHGTTWPRWRRRWHPVCPTLGDGELAQCRTTTWTRAAWSS